MTPGFSISPLLMASFNSCEERQDMITAILLGPLGPRGSQIPDFDSRSLIQDDPSMSHHRRVRQPSMVYQCLYNIYIYICLSYLPICFLNGLFSFIFSISGSLHWPASWYRYCTSGASVKVSLSLPSPKQDMASAAEILRSMIHVDWIDGVWCREMPQTCLNGLNVFFVKWVSMLINVWYSLRFVLSHANYANLLTSVTSSLFSTCHDGKGCPGALGALCSGKQATKHSGNSVRALLGLGAVRSFRWGFLHLPASPTKLSSVSRTCQPMWSNVHRCQLTWPRAVFDWPQPSAEIGLAATHGNPNYLWRSWNFLHGLQGFRGCGCWKSYLKPLKHTKSTRTELQRAILTRSKSTDGDFVLLLWGMHCSCLKSCLESCISPWIFWNAQYWPEQESCDHWFVLVHGR